MSVTEHLDSLKAKHLDLEQLIEQEEARPRPDEAKIHELKRQKLRIKDEIADIAGAGTRPGYELNVGDRQFAGIGVRFADGCGKQHIRVFEQRLLDHRRIDIVSAADNHVLDAAGEPKVAVGIEAP